MLCNRRRVPAIALSALLLVVLGCGGLGLPGGGGTTTPPPEADRVVTGEVAWVDPGSRELEVQDRTGRVVARFDDRTSVFYQGREYRPENLEPGDVVRMDVAGSGYQNVYAQRIQVLESVSDRGDDPYDDEPSDDRHGDDVLAGEVEGVDTGRREIRIETSHGDHVVRYDDRTRVFYRGDAYGPENLEPGDLVRVETVESRGGDAYADRIEVTQAVQDRAGAGDDRHGAERLAGTVEWIDERRGEFGLRTDGRETWTVEVPFDARDSVRDRFAGLDQGDYVRIEAEELGRDRVELVRFL